MAHEIFMTGATGFLGRRLLGELLRQTDCRVHALVRLPCAAASLRKSVGESAYRRIELVQGDLTLPNLGLTTEVVANLARRVTEVWHLAASTRFEESKRDETFRINVDGVRNLLDVVRWFDGLTALYHMSTAYTCGNRLTAVPEGLFEVLEGFKNPYEESKFRAETLLRRTSLPVAIIRPSIIMGDSRTGDNGGDIRMYYGYAFGLLRAVMHTFTGERDFWTQWRNNGNRRVLKDLTARLVGRVGTVKNVVTVDDVISVCMAIRQSVDAVGRTFNVVNRRSLTIDACLHAIQRSFHVNGYRYDASLSASTLNRDCVVERAVYRYTRVYWPYMLETEPKWLTDNTDAVAPARVEITEQLFEFLISRFAAFRADQVTRTQVSLEPPCSMS